MSETVEVYEGTGSADTPDYSGVPSAQLKALVEANLDTDMNTFAERVGIDRKYLDRLIVNPKTPVVRLGLADQIIMALELDMNTLEHHGEITIVPMRGSKSAAIKMVEDTIANAEDSGLPLPTEEEIQARIDSLLETYKTHCQLDETMLAQRERETARGKERRAAAAKNQ